MAGERFVSQTGEDRLISKSCSVADENQNSNASNWVGVAVGLLTLAVFMLDVATGRGYAEGILYVAPVLLTLWTKSLRTTQVLAIVCPLLVIAGYFFSEQNLSDRVTHWLPVSNRLYAFSMVVAAAWIAWQRKRSLMELQQAHDELEGHVQSRLLQALMHTISTSTDFEAAMESTLAKVCATFEWDYAEAWLPRSDKGVLECCSTFTENPNLEPFRHVRVELELPANVGLPGRVWASKEPQWILDVAREFDSVVRADVAADVGLTAGVCVPVMVAPANFALKSALGLPIVAEDLVQVILVFFMRSRPRKRNLMSAVSLLSMVGLQLGTVVQRKRTDTALREAYEELQQKNEELEQFVHTVSHDLKSPLVTIGGMLGMLKEELQEGRLVDAGEIIATGEDTVARMQGLIDDLLKLSRLGRVVSVVQSVDLRTLIEDLIHSHQAELDRRRVTVELTLDVPDVPADRNRLAEVFDNLLVNALKYACDGPAPRIEIGSRAASREVRLFVRDNGPGIEPQQHENVFGLFQQLDARCEGSGVGLAIVRRIMEVHHGRAWVESTPGEGATFWLAFPEQVVESMLIRQDTLTKSTP